MIDKKSSCVDRNATALKIYRVIQGCGYTQAELARIMGVSPIYVSRWTTGRTIPDVDHLALLGETLGVPLDELIVRKKKK